MKNEDNREHMGRDNTASRSIRVWRVYLLVGFIGMLVAVTLWYALNTSTRIVKQYAPQVSAAHHIKIDAILGHLWFEEIISGDRREDINEVWGHFDQAEWYARAMLEGGQSHEGTYIPLSDPILRQNILDVLENIRAFRNIAEERLANIDNSFVGSDIEQRFDDVFDSFLNQADIVENALQQTITRDILSFRSVQFALITLCFVLTGIVAVVLRRFERTRSINMAMLSTANQQLRASEQQLQASNQQLRAGEQQLRAANQQLKASERQLKATNQQLTAHEQQLKATNQQLRASEQQLMTTNQQLKMSESLLLEAQQIAGLGFYILDIAAGTWTSSSILDNIFGIDKDFGRDVEGWLQIVHPDQLDEMSKYLSENILIQRELFDREYRIIRRNDQAVRWVHGLGRLELDDNGEPIRMIGTIQDITERKRAEEANARLSRAIEQADETIVITDAEGTIQYVNPAFERVTGYTVKEAIGQNPRILKSGQHDDAYYKRMWETLSSGNQWHGEITNKKKDGTLFTENATISPVFDSLGKIINYVAAKNDITEAKRLQALQSRAERLETAGKIAGQVAHDFNNLLGPMIAYPDFLRSELPKDHSSIQMLNDIEKAATTMADINQQLLTLSRRGHFELETLSLNNIVTQSIDQMDSQPDTLHIEMDLDKDLMNIKGGPAQLSRIISNLVNNSLDAMESIGHLFIKTENYYADDVSGKYGRIPKGEYVKLTITDTGRGITNEALPKIFDPFFTTKKTDKQRGSGLGLSVVQAVMEDHNGYIDLQSEFGKGTSFFLYFPITRDEIETSDSGEIFGGTESILVIDDDTLQREVALNLLNKLGYNATAVNSGEKAVEFLCDNPHDLLVLDMVMPGGIDGTETYKRALELNPNQKAIIVSGFAETERVGLAIKLGAGKFTRKPLTLKSISAAVRRELDRVVS